MAGMVFSVRLMGRHEWQATPVMNQGRQGGRGIAPWAFYALGGQDLVLSRAFPWYTFSLPTQLFFAAGAQLAHSKPALRTGLMAPAWRPAPCILGVVPDLTCSGKKFAVLGIFTSEIGALECSFMDSQSSTPPRRLHCPATESFALKRRPLVSPVSFTSHQEY